MSTSSTTSTDHVAQAANALQQIHTHLSSLQNLLEQHKDTINKGIGALQKAYKSVGPEVAEVAGADEVVPKRKRRTAVKEKVVSSSIKTTRSQRRRGAVAGGKSRK